MQKPQLVGTFNFLVGGVYLIMASAFVFVTTRLTSLYSEIGTPDQYGIIKYLVLGLEFALGGINIFFGIKLFSRNHQLQQKFLHPSFLIALFSFIGLGFLTGLLVISTILPIYSLTASF